MHNITKWEPESVADLIRSRGFKEEEITQDHPGFKETDKYFQEMKAKMPAEEYEKLIKEMDELMGDPNKEAEEKAKDEKEGEGKTETFFDPEEKKKYEDYEKNKKIAEAERQKQIEKNRAEGEEIVKKAKAEGKKKGKKDADK